jgi:hypothetical protein
VLSRIVAVAALALSLQGCVRYEYEHEFWLRVDGSGTVYVTGRPELWQAFKGLAPPSPASDRALRERARELFRNGGLHVRRVTVTRRDGRPYLFVSADFDDVNALGASGAFPDLRLSLRPKAGMLILDGRWGRSGDAPPSPIADRAGLIAIRFHLPSRIYEHRNATRGVERGNIVSWTESLESALGGTPLALGATLGSRSILWSTILLFATAVASALSILALALFLVVRHGRRSRGAEPGQPPRGS